MGGKKGIAGNPHSPLARYADIKLIVAPREPTAFQHNLRLSARTSMLGLVDIMYLSLLNSPDDAALNKVESVLQLYSRIDEPKPNPATDAERL